MKQPWSDVGYELRAFACIPIRFLFWEGDEEFPAQANVLFDAGATDFIHGESVVPIASVGLDKIVRAAGPERVSRVLNVFIKQGKRNHQMPNSPRVVQIQGAQSLDFFQAMEQRGSVDEQSVGGLRHRKFIFQIGF